MEGQNINIRKAKLSDLTYIISVIRHSFPHWYLRLPYLFLPTLIAELNNKKAGFVMASCKENKGEIALISVDQNSRKQGVGLVLLREALTYLKKINASYCMAKVRVDNEVGFALFSKVNFRLIKVIHRPFLGSVYLIRKDL